MKQRREKKKHKKQEEQKGRTMRHEQMNEFAAHLGFQQRAKGLDQLKRHKRSRCQHKVVPL